MIRTRILLGLWLLFALLFYLFTGAFWGAVLLAASLLLPLYLLALALPVRGRVYCAFLPVRPGGKDRPAVVTVRLENRGKLPVFRGVCTLRLDRPFVGERSLSRFTFSLGRGENKRVDIELRTGFCGGVTVAVDRITCQDPLGVFSLPSPGDAETVQIILPDTFPVEVDYHEGESDSLESVTFSELRRGYDRSETFDLRDYLPGDSLRDVHWKLTGKLDRLVVREPSLPIEHGALILLDTSLAPEAGSAAALGDALLEAAASVAQALAEGGLSLSLGWYDYASDRHVRHDVDTPDDLAGAVAGMLLASRRADPEDGLYKFLHLDDIPAYAHLVCLTERGVSPGRYPVPDGCRVTVLRCIPGEAGAEDTEGQILFTPETAARELAQLTI